MTFQRSSGNVFADLGLANADELLVKADLAHAIITAIRKRGWTQAQASECTGLTQPEISRLGKIKTDGFSQERMQTVLRRLGMDVELHIHHREDVVNRQVGNLKVREFTSAGLVALAREIAREDAALLEALGDD